MCAIDVSLFRSELAFFDCRARDRLGLFQELGDRLGCQGYIEPTWLTAILARERDYPTGLACRAISVAIPHTDPEHLNMPYIALIRPTAPIEFEPMAGLGDPVQAELIVNLGLREHEDGQVAILQALMGAFMDTAAAAEILAQTTPEDLAAVMARRCG